MTDNNTPEQSGLDDDWASAMAEQTGSAPQAEEDPWAAAFA